MNYEIKKQKILELLNIYQNQILRNIIYRNWDEKSAILFLKIMPVVDYCHKNEIRATFFSINIKSEYISYLYIY